VKNSFSTKTQFHLPLGVSKSLEQDKNVQPQTTRELKSMIPFLSETNCNA
jgi:hypothetical protein